MLQEAIQSINQKRMKKNIYIFIVIGIILVSACKGTKTEESNMDIIEIDLDQAKQISFTEWFDSIQIVPLETTDQSLIKGYFGLPDQVIFYGDLIYIFDEQLRHILVFDNNGKFINSTSHLRGQGPSEYTGVADFDVNDLTGNLIISNPPTEIIIYNTDLEFVSRHDMSNNLWPVSGIKLISNDIALFYNSRKEDNELVNVFSIKENKVIKKICPIENGGKAKRTISTRLNYNFYKINDTLCFIPRFSHNQVFYYDPVKVEFFPRMEFKIKQNAFSSSKLSQNQNDSYYNIDILKSNDYAFLYDIKETDRYYFSSILYREKTYINKYDKVTGKNQVIDLPFLERQTLSPDMLIKDNVLYQFIPAPDAGFDVRNIKHLSEKNIRILENMSEDDNPCIVKIFIKD